MMSPAVQRRIKKTILPYQLQSIGLLHHFIARGLYTAGSDYRLEVRDPKGVLIIQGNHKALSNPVMEVGVLQCRVLLEFLGLKISKHGVLTPLLSKRGKDDVWLCDLSTPARQLGSVSPSQLLSVLPNSRREKLAALKLTLINANKGMAHLTTGPRYDRKTLAKFSLACELIAEAVSRFLYDALKIARPSWRPKLTKRPVP